MRTFRQFLEQVGHTHQTPQQQINARDLERTKRRRHFNIIKSKMRSASSYDKEQQHDIEDIEDRRS
jgi:hypothetical protein